MKKSLKNVSIIILFILVMVKRPIIITSIVEAINIWITTIFPALFPFLILSDLIISSNLINYITDILGPIFNKLFKLSKYSSYAFFMSMISGTPSNAKYIKDLLDNKLIGVKEASKILSMSLLYNPILILTITVYLERRDAYLIILLNIIINLIIGLLNRKELIEEYNYIKLIPKDFNLISSISKTIDTLLLVLGSLVLFIALSSLIPLEHPLIDGIFEITNGIKEINNNFSYDMKLLFTGILLSFGGLSIQTQIKSILKEYLIDYSLFYKSRIIHLILFIIFIKIRLLI